MREMISRVVLNIIAEAAFHLEKDEVESRAPYLRQLFGIEFGPIEMLRMTPMFSLHPFHWLRSSFWRSRSLIAFVRSAFRQKRLRITSN
jgi:hypothetical protein